MTEIFSWTCTGCALLCEDIQVRKVDNRLEHVEHACMKGKARIFGCKDRAIPAINGKKADTDDAIKYAARILREAKNPLLYGWSNSTNEAQMAGIELARTLGGVIDSTSSFCQGIIVNEILNGSIPSCTLEDVREKADVILFWGADPMSSHPRHMSKYSYFPRGELRQRGYEEDRTAISIDVRQSMTAKICKNGSHRIPPGMDAVFMRGLVDALSGRVPKLSFDYDVKRILELAAILKKAEFGVLFAGLGLVYSIKEDISLLCEFINALNKISHYSLIPMAGHFNMRGFNHTLHEKSSHIHRVKFTEGEAISGIEYSVVEQIKNHADAVLVVGSDPLSSLPASISRRLKDIPLILIDPCINMTSLVADVTIPCSTSGIEVGGTSVRMDGKTININALVHGNHLSDEMIIRQIIKEIK
ncbi:MAG: formylmethanofuran dehydrogenase subunit B [Methanosarcinales archaeon]|nr:formylmethanofuran dehydrogenase subunit B [Methanosarcinales archaeon]